MFAPSRPKVYETPLAVMVLFVSAVCGVGQESQVPELHFSYDKRAPLDPKEVSVQNRGDAAIHDVTYESSAGRRVPAYLVVPKGGGKFAAILWGHWLMSNSPSANRSEFLDEAAALANAGVISLLIDAPQAPGPDSTPKERVEVPASDVPPKHAAQSRPWPRTSRWPCSTR